MPRDDAGAQAGGAVSYLGKHRSRRRETGRARGRLLGSGLVVLGVPTVLAGVVLSGSATGAAPEQQVKPAATVQVSADVEQVVVTPPEGVAGDPAATPGAAVADEPGQDTGQDPGGASTGTTPGRTTRAASTATATRGRPTPAAPARTSAAAAHTTKARPTEEPPPPPSKDPDPTPTPEPTGGGVEATPTP
ncbi:MAG: hypothetical protein U0Q15_10090 [Kineosporiaceae bacterium]